MSPPPVFELENAIRAEFGDHAGSVSTMAGVFVSRTTPPPPTAIVKMSAWPPEVQLRENAIRVPPGLYAGACSSATLLVRRLRPIPPGVIDQMSNLSLRPVSKAIRPLWPGNAAAACGAGLHSTALRPRATTETTKRDRIMDPSPVGRVALCLAGPPRSRPPNRTRLPPLVRARRERAPDERQHLLLPAAQGHPTLVLSHHGPQHAGFRDRAHHGRVQREQEQGRVLAADLPLRHASLEEPEGAQAQGLEALGEALDDLRAHPPRLPDELGELRPLLRQSEHCADHGLGLPGVRLLLRQGLRQLEVDAP